MTVKPLRLVQDAIAFAARAHDGQLRRDHRTPYVSHPFRVAMIVRDVFGFDDPHMFAAAVLHDTIEDTRTDYDDLEEAFGAGVATWVSILTKNKSMPFNEREVAYCRGLTASPWQVQVCKLADILDNLMDDASLTAQGKQGGLANAKRYLEALKTDLKEEARLAWNMVSEVYEQKINDVSD
jgi:guanosine-3',5'-bis(diphosphate) 3'-pyrophosphohydrolase